MIPQGPTASKIQAPQTPGKVTEIQFDTFVFVDKPLHMTYEVQPGDKIGNVAAHVYGVSNRHTRNSLRKQGFEVGSTVTNKH